MERMTKTMEAKKMVWKVMKLAFKSGCYVTEKYPFPSAISVISVLLYLFLPPFFFLPFLVAVAYICIFTRPRIRLSESDLTHNASASSSDDGASSQWTADDARNLMDLGHSEIERNRRLETLIARRRSNKFFKINSDASNTDEPPAPEDHLPGSAPSVLHPHRNPFDLPYDPTEEKPDLAADAFHKDFTLPCIPSATDISGASKNDDETSALRFPDSLPCPIPRIANANANASSEEKSKKDAALLNALVNSHRSCNSIASDLQVEVSETGSPPFTVDGSGSSSEGDSCKYDVDVDKDASCENDNVSGESPHAPPRSDISCSTEGNSSGETGKTDGEAGYAMEVLEEVNPFGNSDVNQTILREIEEIPQDGSSSFSPKSVLQPSGALRNGRTPSEPMELTISYVSESGRESPSLAHAGSDDSEKKSKEELYFTEQRNEAEASKSIDEGVDIDESTNHDEDGT